MTRGEYACETAKFLQLLKEKSIDQDEYQRRIRILNGSLNEPEQINLLNDPEQGPPPPEAF